MIKSLTSDGYFEEEKSLINGVTAKSLDDYFSSNTVYKVPKEFTLRFLKKSAKLEELSTTDYCVFADCANHCQHHSNVINYIWYDAKYTFVLIKEKSIHQVSFGDKIINKMRGYLHKPLVVSSEKPLAYITFDYHLPSEIRIEQIQGVIGMIEYLKHLKWTKMLLSLTVNWTKQNGIKKIRVTPAEKNEWMHIRQGVHGKLIYDVTAQRSGFKKDKEGYFYKDLV